MPFSPVFDGMNIYADDDQGTVYGWSQSNGTPLLGWPRSPGTPVPVSAPVLLQDGSLLVVTQDGTVARAFKGSNPPLQPLVTLNRFVSPSSPSAPAIDQRTSAWGVAYVGDGAGWLAAVQLPAPPVQASTSVWPRAGRDSCNSRNAGSSCN